MKKNPFIITDDYSGMGSFVEALKYLKIPPEELALFRTEFDSKKNDIFDSVHGNWLDRLSDYKHVLDATSEDASAEGVKAWIKTTYTDVDGDGSPDLMSITSPCHGASALNHSEKAQMMKNKATSTLKNVMKRARKLAPKDYFHEMVNSDTKKSQAGSEMFDILLHDKTGELSENTDFDNPEHVRYMWNELQKRGLYKPKLSLKGEDFGPQTNAHEFRASYPLSIENVFGDKPFLRNRPPEHQIFDPNLYLNVPREPGESFVDYAVRLSEMDPSELGENPDLSYKATLNRHTYSGNSGNGSMLWNTITRGAGNGPVRFKKKDFTTEELNTPPWAYPNGPGTRKVFNKKVFPYLEDPEGLYRDNLPAGVAATVAQFNKPTFRLPGDNGTLQPGEIYEASELTPEQGARLLGWSPEIVPAARKAGLTDAEIRAAYGDAYPLQHAVMVLLQSPALWARFPEQMKAAQEDFLRHNWSDLRLKDIKPSDAMLKTIRRMPWIERRRN